jgi:phospholipid/cholesterol/gamma-HCH transport system substrate-binding protein/paraquat-inducible protein B
VSDRARYFRLGVFVLAGIALLVALTLALGSERIFTRGTVLETYFDESVQGVDIGSPVKRRGVEIGRIQSIGFLAQYYPLPRDPNEAIRYGRLVVVRMRVTGSWARDPGDPKFQSDLALMVQQGLRIRIAAQGLTGTSYLELDFLDPARNPPLPILWKPYYTYVPSAPSAIKSLSTAAERVFDRIDQIQIEELVANLDAALVSVKKAVEDAKVGETGAEVRRLAQQAQRTLADARETSVVVRDVVSRTDVSTTQRALESALAQITATVRRLDLLVASEQGDVDSVVADLREVANNLRSVTEGARSYPSALLFGEPPPPFRPPEKRE